MDDKILITSIKEQPKEGLIQAFDVYGPLVKAIIVKILGNDKPRDVEECVSDTFIKLWVSVDSFNEELGNLRGYIATIARNTAIDKYRKNNSKIKLHSLDEIDVISNLDVEGDVLKVLM